MPEPLVYLQSLGAAALASTLLVLAMGGMRRPASAARRSSACVLAMGGGLALGVSLLSWRPAWPPASGLDRFLTIVLPVALVIELIVGFPWVSRRLAWLLRLGLAAILARILLHGSVYLGQSREAWPLGQAVAVLAICGVLLATVWGLLSWLEQRRPGVSLHLALALALQCGGIAILLAGYVKGGAISFSLTAALVGASLGCSLISQRTAAPAILGVGVVSLFSVLFIGRFFGRLGSGEALVVLLAPLLCWATELPLLRRRPPWLVGSLRLLLVAIPLLVVLIAAKRTFDRDLAPLLGHGQGQSRDCPRVVARSVA